MQPRISVILPTIGRETFQAAYDSCAGADEIIVVEDLELRDRGYWARTKGMAQATGTHLAFLDDDDVFVPGAIELMRAAACDRPVIFKMDDPLHGILWREPVLRYANVGTPMFLVPNQPDTLGVWEPHERDRGGDFRFITTTVGKQGDPVWRDDIVCVVRPHERRPSITVVTPWWNHHEHLADYKLAIACGNPDELIVVDQGSEPSVDLPGIRLEDNVGFARACNLGLEAATSEAVLFLNNDIAATRPDWLRQIRAAIEPGVLVGAQLRNDPHAAVDGLPMPYLDGWCLAGMRDDLLDLGGFDESLMEPSYYGDNLLCLEARAAGMSLREAKVGLRHKVNGSTNPAAPNVAEATNHNRAVFETRVRTLLATV